MSQDYTERDLHRFVMGEIRTDGWKSEWRKDFERRNAEAHAKPKPLYPDAPRPAFDQAAYMRSRRAELMEMGLCIDCRKPANGYRQCEECLEKRARQLRERRRKLAA